MNRGHQQLLLGQFTAVFLGDPGFLEQIKLLSFEFLQLSSLGVLVDGNFLALRREENGQPSKKGARKEGLSYLLEKQLASQGLLALVLLHLSQQRLPVPGFGRPLLIAFTSINLGSEM
jgi:hypothetical protein